MGIKLDLSINETNMVLASLGKQPFEAVAALICFLHEVVNQLD